VDVPSRDEEAVMYRRASLVLPLLMLILPSCSTQLHTSKEVPSSYVLALREEYFASNPDGQYNENIRNGEVVRGMDFLEVLASWGHPAERKKDSQTMEEWTYREIDEVSKDWVEYTFMFRQSILEDWSIARHVAKGGALMAIPKQGETLIRGQYTTGKRVPE
jgi:hypothetical protein